MHGDIEMIVRDLIEAGEVDDVQAAAFAGVVSGMSDADQRALLGVLMGAYDAWGQARSDAEESREEMGGLQNWLALREMGVVS